jgi:iron complex transport system ATP-binding protein
VPNVISLNDVTVVRDNKEILSHVTWAVQPDERWVIMGPNGAGKTTMMQVCSGYMHPTTGDAQVLGYTLGETNVRELRTLIGISSAAVAALLPPLETVFDSVLTAAHGVTGRWRERYDQIDIDRAHELINEWNLSGLVSRTIGTLSEGERKRVQIARALMCDPELLILDEPAAGLDVAGREDLVARLSALAADPRSPALILVTHHVEEIPPNFTHAMLLSNGSASAIGDIVEVVASEPMSRAFNTPLVVEFSEDRWYARGRTPSRGRRAKD